MEFVISAHTDIGTRKETNQDSFCAKVARTPQGRRVAMVVVCDGMGGLAKGEVASAAVTRTFADWFGQELPLFYNDFSVDRVVNRWEELIQGLNTRIAGYGQAAGIQLGTTLTVLLVVEGSGYLVGHVGDSCAFMISGGITRLTEDQTVVGLEMQQGRITKEQAETDQRKNVLLQCIGASSAVVPQYVYGTLENAGIFLLCSDGFYRALDEGEILGAINRADMTPQEAKKQLIELTELAKSRGETDNITGILLQVF